jgi:hypothetical protein
MSAPPFRVMTQAYLKIYLDIIGAYPFITSGFNPVNLRIYPSRFAGEKEVQQVFLLIGQATMSVCRNVAGAIQTASDTFLNIPGLNYELK